MKLHNRALALILTLVLILSGITVAESLSLNGGASGEKASVALKKKKKKKATKKPTASPTAKSEGSSEGGSSSESSSSGGGSSSESSSSGGGSSSESSSGESAATAAPKKDKDDKKDDKSDPTPSPSPSPSPKPDDGSEGSSSGGERVSGSDTADVEIDPSEPTPTPKPKKKKKPKKTKKPRDYITGIRSPGWKGAVPAHDEGMSVPVLYQFDYPETILVLNGKKRSVASSGCGPTSLSMVIAYFTGDTTQDPHKLFREGLNAGRYHGSGFDCATLSWLAARHGVHGEWIPNTVEGVVNALKAGHPVIARMGPGVFTRNGHYIVLRGLNKDGKIIVNDPNSAFFTGMAYRPEAIIKEAKGSNSFMVCSRAVRSVEEEESAAIALAAADDGGIGEESDDDNVNVDTSALETFEDDEDEYEVEDDSDEPDDEDVAVEGEDVGRDISEGREAVALAGPGTVAPGEAVSVKAHVNSPGSTLNIREAASSDSDIVARLHDDDQLTICSVGYGWVRVRLADGTEGYAWREYLALDEPMPVVATATPEPTPAPTPEPPSDPTSLEIRAQGLRGTAYVTLEDPEGKLNVRAEARSDGMVLTQLTCGEAVTCIGSEGEWVRVRTATGVEAYVRSDFLSTEKPVATPEPTVQPTFEPTTLEIRAQGMRGTAYVVLDDPEGKLNARAEARSGASVIRQLSFGEAVSCLSSEGEWVCVSLSDGAQAYVRSDFLSSEKPVAPTPEPTAEPTIEPTPEPTAEPAPEPKRSFEGRMRVDIEDGRLNVRAEPGTDSAIVTTLGPDEIVDIYGREGDWYFVRVGGGEGYVRGDYLSRELTRPTPVPTPTPAPTPEPTEAPEAPEEKEDKQEPKKATTEKKAPKKGEARVKSGGTPLNVRKGKDNASEVVTTLKDGEIVKVLEGRTGWVHIRTNGGETGYVWHEYLVFPKETEARPAEAEAPEAAQSEPEPEQLTEEPEP